MPISTLMIIRHAEKPVPGRVGGVRERGRADDASLSARGWQRAGALVRFFSDPWLDGIRRPDQLHAGRFDASAVDASRRPRQTLKPLAHALGLPLEAPYVKGQEAALAAALMRRDGIALVAWSHEDIPALVRAMPHGDALALPARWPEHRFDVTWVLDRERAGWRFRQVPQRLLAGDAVGPIEVGGEDGIAS